MNKHHEQMLADGFPAGLLLTSEQRDLAWKAAPPLPMPRFDDSVKKDMDPSTAALLAEIETAKRTKTSARIAKLVASKQREDVSGKRWDPRRCRWVPDDAPGAAPKGTAAPRARPPAQRTVAVSTKPGSKTAIIADLLRRPGGCTTKDVLEATGWPSVSMPAQARIAGLTLVKEKVDGATRYRGEAKS